MGLKVIIKFFTESSEDTIKSVFGTFDIDIIFDALSDLEIIKRIEDYIREQFDKR